MVFWAELITPTVLLYRYYDSDIMLVYVISVKKLLLTDSV